MPGPQDCIFQHLLEPEACDEGVTKKVPITFFHRASMLTKILKIHVYSFKTLDARASGLSFPTPSWAWGLWRRCYQKVPIMFFHIASMLTKICKIHVYILKTLDARASGQYFPTRSWAWSLPWRWYQKVPIKFFHGASMLTKIPKIYVYSFKTLVARASGLYFPTPSWAWSLPWRWYQKVPIKFFHRASMLTKIPKIHVYSFKILDARASGLHFPTPFWAWGQPWEWYLKFNPITSLPIYWWRLSPNFIPLALQVWEEFAKNHCQELKDSLL